MNRTRPTLSRHVTAIARHSLENHHFPRIESCLALLTEKEIWSRANSKSNSVGNLVLHLNGNLRQWILSGLGGVPFDRDREKEFSERGPIPRAQLLRLLKSTVRKAGRIIEKLTAAELQRPCVIQRFNVSGLEALLHATEHFALHTGQIIFMTKMKRRQDLRFTRLPGENPKRRVRHKLPAI